MSLSLYKVTSYFNLSEFITTICMVYPIMLLLVAGILCYGLLLNVTQVPLLSPRHTTSALLCADPGLVPEAQSFVDWVETCNLQGGRPIVEGHQWPIMEPSLHSPHPIGRSLAFLDWTSLALGGQGHINHGMMMWRTGGVSVGGGQGLNCRVKARVVCLTIRV